MKISFTDSNKQRFSLTGKCPHCGLPSVFTMPSGTVPYSESRYIDGYPHQHLFAMLECSGCYGFILGIIMLDGNYWKYIVHHPVGKPDDSVAEEIPPNIAEDFKEALRCLWVDAYNATAEMCRRAVEASCIDLGAKGKVLEDMIDSLADKRTITPFLQQVAHKIRLGGNRGAHPPEDGHKSDEHGPIMKIEKEHAEAIVKFTREFFHHVYVVAKQLDKYDFSKPKAKS